MSQERIERLVEIEKQIEALIQEGIQIADEQKVTFDLGNTTFAEEYGSGGYRYIPEGSDEAAERRENEWLANEDWRCVGWITSSSDCD